MTACKTRFAFILVASLSFGVSFDAVAQESRAIEDDEIRRALDAEMWEARAVDANQIDVGVAGGVVTLSGTVDNIIEKERALRIAKMTRGVSSVIDRLEVEATDRSDAAIAEDVAQALFIDPATDAWEIEVAVMDGTVTLSGEVSSYAERTLGGNVAKSVRGVRALHNRLDVSHPVSRLDAEMLSEIEQSIAWDVRLDDARIDVEVDDGEVVLDGSIGSEYERDVAIAAAWVPGVTDVDASGLEVRWWSDDMQRPTAYVARDDGEIAEAVRRALAHDPRVTAFDVTVSADNGAVTLGGIVDNLKAKRAAGQAALNTVGVWRVKNYVKVRPIAPTSDMELAASVRAAFERDPLIASGDVSVVVEDGEANLYGNVESHFERDHAEDVATRVGGVVGVDNHLIVAYGAPRYSYNYSDWDPFLYDYDYDYATVVEKTDAEIADDIESEMFWSPYVDANEVDVRVEDGVATLAGTVDDLHERQSAAENALEGGAFRVVNELDLDVEVPN